MTVEDDLNAIGWRDFILWAWREPQIRAQFTAATGIEIRTVKTPIDAAIDIATGAREGLIAKFIKWVTREHWGIEYAPREYQKAIAEKETA